MITERLRSYKAKKARIAVLDVQINQLYEYIHSLHWESSRERIEGRVFQLPISEPVQSGSVSDPTPSIAFSDNYGEIEKAKARVDMLRSEKASLQYGIDEIDAALSVLTEPELFVIEEYYIQGFAWQQVLIHWMNRNGRDMSESWAKKQRDIGLGKMEKIIQIA